MKSEDFGETFIWGAAISAAQTESAALADGKGMSIWDEFCQAQKGFFTSKFKIKNRQHLNYSSDFYIHFKTDIDLLKSMGFKHFRFSIAWSRILPDGETINLQGIAFYQEVIQYCIDSEIEPWVTLYHWDLPAVLEKKGGWTNRAILDWFALYAEVCVTYFKQVKYWMVLNEPSVFVGAGYFFGIHAPGKRGFDNFFKAMHHANLCIGHIYRLIKKINPQLQVGSTFSFTHIESIDDQKRNTQAASIADLLINRLFFEPIIGLGYPREELNILKQIEKHTRIEDAANLGVPLDFIGIQTYTREVFKWNPLNPLLKIKQVPAQQRTKQLTAMNWEVYPPSIYHVLKKIAAYNTSIPLIITENGMALKDEMVGGVVNDQRRIEYFEKHLEQVSRAMEEGVDLRGYFAWSLIDNFEWAEGYHPRFGLVHIDFITKQRTMKQSAYWFKSFLT
ncbi:MAG: GH1 family beta-glucosidase [bacterium]|nr:GH1 family beta-glucosidase [bacterium]